MNVFQESNNFVINYTFLSQFIQVIITDTDTHFMIQGRGTARDDQTWLKTMHYGISLIIDDCGKQK